jgi:hypothetical protein
MAIFNSYVKLPEGKSSINRPFSIANYDILWLIMLVDQKIHRHKSRTLKVLEFGDVGVGDLKTCVQKVVCCYREPVGTVHPWPEVVGPLVTGCVASDLGCQISLGRGHLLRYIMVHLFETSFQDWQRMNLSDRFQKCANWEFTPIYCH